MAQPFRCPECRTRRSDYNILKAHCKSSGHHLCNCGGYHYSHRPGSPFCESNPLSALRLADRGGADENDLKRAAKHIIEESPNAEAQVRELLIHWGIEYDN